MAELAEGLSRPRSKRSKRLQQVAALATLVGGSLAFSGQAEATTHPTGSACGYFTKVSLGGGPYSVRGCGQTIPPGTAGSASPSVTLPAGGSTTVVAKSDSNGALGQYGPAVIFGGKATATTSPPSGLLKVTTTGTTKVISTALVKNVGPNTFTADQVSSKCSAAAPATTTGSATITNGVVATATDADGEATQTVAVPNPTPKNYTVNGSINNVGDTFKIVFNEQVKTADGSITVNGAHMYLLGPFAKGDTIIAQSKCGH